MIKNDQLNYMNDLYWTTAYNIGTEKKLTMMNDEF